jgi:hypothetical protein
VQTAALIMLFDCYEAATKAGLGLKRKYPHIQVIVFGAKERTRTAVELSEQPEETKQPKAAYA